MIQGFCGSANSIVAKYSPRFLAVCLFISFSAAQENSDPAAIWYRAFLTYESSLELEKSGKFLEALNKCNEAKALYDGLAYNFPDFQPDIVRFKQQIVADTRLRIIDTNQRHRKGEHITPNVERPPLPVPSGTLPAPGELPNIDVPGNQGPSYHETPIAEENSLPSWNQNPRVTRQAHDLLNEAKNESARKDSIIEQLRRENEMLKSERDASEARFQQTQKELEIVKREHAKLTQQIEQLERTPQNQNAQQTIQEYRDIARKAMEVAKAQTEKSSQLLGQLRAAENKIASQAARIKELEEEKDNLAKIIQGKGMGTEALKELVDQNQRLSKRLDLAEKYALRASNDLENKDQDIALLKSEIQKVRGERETLIAENIKHQQQIEALQKKLEMLSDGLSDDDKNALTMAPEQKAENELLRSMVLKQLARQAQLKQAKDLLLRQLDRLGVRSESLFDKIEDITRGVQPTAEEMKLFKSPGFQEMLQEASVEVAGTIVYNTLSAPATATNRTAIEGQKVNVVLAQIDKAARLDYKEGRLAEAEEGFLKYLHYRPQNVQCLCNLGILKIQLQNYSEAEQYLQRAIALDKDSGTAQYLLGRTYFFQNRFDEALNHLEQGIQLQPNNATAHNCVGVIASQKGWASRAEKAFGKAVEIEPKFGDAYFNLAVLLSSQGRSRFESAKNHYFKALELGVPRDGNLEQILKKTAQGMEVGMR